MASIVVCGGSVIGLASAMMLARDGHRVTVLERDAAPPPPDSAAAAWDGWSRPGVAQFHQPHNLFSRARLVLDEELPGVVDRLVEAGCVWVDLLAMAPPSLDKTPREGDDRFPFVTGRRPVIEAVLAGGRGRGGGRRHPAGGGRCRPADGGRGGRRACPTSSACAPPRATSWRPTSSSTPPAAAPGWRSG